MITKSLIYDAFKMCIRDSVHVQQWEEGPLQVVIDFSQLSHSELEEVVLPLIHMVVDPDLKVTRFQRNRIFYTGSRLELSLIHIYLRTDCQAHRIRLKGVRSGKQSNGSSRKDSADGRSGRFRRLYDFNGLFFEGRLDHQRDPDRRLGGLFGRLARRHRCV